MKIDDKSFNDCETCIKTNMIIRKKFNKNPPRATKPLHRVFTDLIGPIDPVAYDGSVYAIIFIDDATRYGRVYTLKQKSESIEGLKRYLP
jgi:hypothetical protein